MNIEIQNSQDDLPLQDEFIRNLVREVFKFLKISTDQLNLHFVDERTLTNMHEEYFDDPTPTDCITFPIDPPGISKSETPQILGEIFLSPIAALEFSPDSPYEELSLYIVHGILHLIGFDDIEDNEREIMRSEEIRILSHLKEKKLILSSTEYNSSQNTHKSGNT